MTVKVSRGDLLASDLARVVADPAVPWEALRGARVLVTGATGFFGCWLLETFLRANDRFGLGASLVAMTRDPRAFAQRLPHLARHAAISLHEGDIRTFEAPRGRISHVIHAAVDATPPATSADRERVFDVIVTGTRRALECARRAGAERFLFASSGAVYGSQPIDLLRIPEEYRGGPDPADRATVGAEAKRAAEALCAASADTGLQPVIARCFTFIGPYMQANGRFAAGDFVRAALSGGPIVVNGDGTPVRSYMYAADLAIWLWAILLRGKAMRPYNVGSDEPTTIAGLARSIAARFSPPLEVVVGAARMTGAGGARYVPRTARAREELGLEATVGLEEAVARTVDWHAAG